MKTIRLITKLLTFISLFLYLSISIQAQSKSELIDEYMAEYFKKNLFHGSVLISKDSEVIFEKGYGLANREWNTAFKPDTKMDIASMTKPFTSMLVMQQVESGNIKLDGKISDYLEDYRKDVGEKVSIHHLLSNTSGIPDIMEYPEMRTKLIQHSYTVDYAIKQFCSGDLLFEPGSKFQYCSSGFLILGAILERVTGKSYEALLKEYIFTQAEMKNSGVDKDSLILENRASGYIPKGNHFIREPYMNMGMTTSAGGMYSTVEDIFKFNKAINNGKLLSEKYLNIMFTPNVEAFGGRGKYAYGWVLFKIPVNDSGKVAEAVGHGGTFYGKETLMTRLPEDQYLIVIFCNTEVGQRTLTKMTMDITRILYR